jgi:hypothetical protein
MMGGLFFNMFESKKTTTSNENWNHKSS